MNIGFVSIAGNYLKLIEEVGFREVHVIKRLDYFGGSSSENTKRLTKTFGAESIVVSANKPKHEHLALDKVRRPVLAPKRVLI